MTIDEMPAGREMDALVAELAALKAANNTKDEIWYDDRVVAEVLEQIKRSGETDDAIS